MKDVVRRAVTVRIVVSAPRATTPDFEHPLNYF
jgi:hypothetical protein